MKYLMLIYTNPRNWGHPAFLHSEDAVTLPAAEREALARQLDELITEIDGSGELLAVQALADPGLTRTIRVRDGATLSTDGPFIEAKEQMAGAFVLDVATPERAAEIAARIPEARFTAVELRPIMDPSGQEM